MLRAVAIVAGICCSILFVATGLRYQLQTYGDGAMFSYAVAVQDAWAFHWHNISGRLAVYLLCLAPAESYVALTGDPGGGIVVYGFLFFSAPLLGLLATFAADRSRGHTIFGYACFSTAVLCPLVFGFPTEMWLTHALFWPALAVSRYARGGIGGALVFVILLVLILTHEAAIIFAIAIVAGLLLQGPRDAALLRSARALTAALAIWVAVKLAFPPDDYFAGVLKRAALSFFDVTILGSGLVLLLCGAIAAYVVIFSILAHFAPARAHVYAAAIVAAALAAYWVGFDQSLHAANRYYTRTALVAGTPMLGLLAALDTMRADGRLAVPFPFLARVMEAFTNRVAARAVAGALLIVMLIHAVETAKFVAVWTKYKAAVAALATGTASDTALGDPQFVSSDRIGRDLNRLSWYSTTPYLSVIVARFAPTRLVMAPRTDNYFWLSCETATANLRAARVVPPESRRLVRIHACLHR